MNLIYEPKGRAAEYSPLAVNPYSGCDHACTYCYMKSMTRGGWKDKANVRSAFSVKALARDIEELHATKNYKQVLISFSGDPYCAENTTAKATRECLNVFLAYKHPVAVLTKGGTRCLEDIDIFRKFPRGAIKVGASLVWSDDEYRKSFEPGAAYVEDRVNALKALHDSGVQTWVSMEPVIDPVQALEVVDMTHEFVDEYRVGPLNHSTLTKGVDWSVFFDLLVSKLDKLGKGYYLKNDFYAAATERMITPRCKRSHDECLATWPVTQERQSLNLF